MKLGEALVKKGLITTAQLESALKAQLIFGGHLGTCLIESGYIDEETLGEVLASSAGVPYAPIHLLANIPPATIQAIPKRIAVDYRAIPIKIDGNAVHVAFVNPKDLRSLDALKFTTGRKVVAWIAPEVRILQALETYYGAERRARFIKLDHKLAERPQSSPARGKAARATPKDDFVSFAPVDPQTEFGYDRPWQEVAEEHFGRDFAEHDPPKPMMSLPELAESFCRADSRDDLARAALDFGAGRAHRMLLMIVRTNRASVWQERGFSLADGVRSDAQFDVTTDALFRTLLGNDHFYGALPTNDEARSFFDRLGVAAPAELVLVPIHVNDRLVAAALADSGPKGRMEGDVHDFLRAFRLFSTAVLMVALRKNLRDAAQPLELA